MVKGWGGAALIFMLGAGPVAAHSPVPGMAGFYLGLLHPFSAPPQALLMLGLGLLMGPFEGRKIQLLLGGFLIASLAGLVFAHNAEQIDSAMFALAFCTCTIAALLPGRILPLALLIAALGGGLIGADSIPDAGPARDRFFTMSGSIVGANIGLLYLWAGMHWVRKRFAADWVAIAFRVAAAWGAAIALLMVALKFAEAAPWASALARL